MPIIVQFFKKKHVIGRVTWPHVTLIMCVVWLERLIRSHPWINIYLGVND